MRKSNYRKELKKLQNELVSIITPSYNTGQYIAKTIESVLDQTYENWEMIIVDDCSTDNTDEIISQYLADNRIKYIKKNKNSGAAISRNIALKEAKGKWIAFLDSDDLWLPNKLEKQVEFMKKNNYKFSYTRYSEINQDGIETNVHIAGPKRITERSMYNYCWVGCLTVMYDREAIGLIQAADLKSRNDYAMWLQICKNANCYLLDEELALYRRGRVGSLSTKSYINLIKAHYRLFRQAERKNVILAVIATCRNLIFGVWKKIKYVR